PKFEDPEVGVRLAFTGAVKDDILDLESLAARLAGVLWRNYPEAMRARYKLDPAPDVSDPDLLLEIGKRRGYLISGGEIDLERTSRVLLEEYRAAKIGRFTLELPPAEEV
ncbi:MAG: ribosome biogenesis GTPase YlqF, partial [Oscillospiraceae bacterium]|nr:ribosome biogenesis GTPase YlqF [Oscillospiraceae bacterium]